MVISLTSGSSSMSIKTAPLTGCKSKSALDLLPSTIKKQNVWLPVFTKRHESKHLTLLNVLGYDGVTNICKRFSRAVPVFGTLSSWQLGLAGGFSMFCVRSSSSTSSSSSSRDRLFLLGVFPLLFNRKQEITASCTEFGSRKKHKCLD